MLIISNKMEIGYYHKNLDIIIKKTGYYNKNK